MYLTHKIKYVYFSPVFQVALWISIPLLLLTLVFGLNLNEAKRVLPLPFNLTFQTSDLAKLTLIMYLARLLTKKARQYKRFQVGFCAFDDSYLVDCFVGASGKLFHGSHDFYHEFGVAFYWAR